MTPKESIENIFSEYGKVINDFSVRIDTLTEQRKTKESDHEKLMKEIEKRYPGLSFVGLMKAMKSDPDTKKEKAILDDIARIETERKTLKRCIIVAEDNAIRSIANVVISEFIRNPETWTKYPYHYKRFKTLFENTFGSSISFFTSSFSKDIYTSRFHHGHNSISILFSDSQSIENEWIERQKSVKPYETLDPEQIETTTRKAIEARTIYIEKYEEAKKELETIRGEFNFSGLYDIFPYIENLKTWNSEP